MCVVYLCTNTPCFVISFVQTGIYGMNSEIVRPIHQKHFLYSLILKSTHKSRISKKNAVFTPTTPYLYVFLCGIRIICYEQRECALYTPEMKFAYFYPKRNILGPILYKNTVFLTTKPCFVSSFVRNEIYVSNSENERVLHQK